MQKVQSAQVSVMIARCVISEIFVDDEDVALRCLIFVVVRHVAHLAVHHCVYNTAYTRVHARADVNHGLTETTVALYTLYIQQE